jgi:hypothetical protein
MKLAELLREDIVTPWKMDVLSTDLALDNLAKNHKGWLKAVSTGGILFRGFSDGQNFRSDFTTIDSTEAKRTSRDGDNIYQLMMDASFQLRKYPSRSNSFICTTSLTQSISHGEPFMMIPADGTQIAVTPVSDIWGLEIKSDLFKADIDRMSYIWKRLFRIIKITNDFGTRQFISADRLDAELSKLSPKMMLVFAILTNMISVRLDSSIATELWAINRKYLDPKVGLTDEDKQTLEHAADTFVADDGLAADFYRIISQDPKHMFTAISDNTMTPSNLDLKLVKYGSALEHNVECWFSGKCLVVKMTAATQMVQQLIESKHPVSPYVLQELGLKS